MKIYIHKEILQYFPQIVKIAEKIIQKNEQNIIQIEEDQEGNYVIYNSSTLGECYQEYYELMLKQSILENFLDSNDKLKMAIINQRTQNFLICQNGMMNLSENVNFIKGVEETLDKKLFVLNFRKYFEQKKKIFIEKVKSVFNEKNDYFSNFENVEQVYIKLEKNKEEIEVYDSRFMFSKILHSEFEQQNYNQFEKILKLVSKIQTNNYKIKQLQIEEVGVQNKNLEFLSLKRSEFELQIKTLLYGRTQNKALGIMNQLIQKETQKMKQIQVILSNIENKKVDEKYLNLLNQIKKVQKDINVMQKIKQQ